MKKENGCTQYTVIKVRLHPTAEQADLIEKTFGSCRYLWNKMLTDVQEFYAATDLHYVPTPACYKKEAPFLKEVDSQALCAVHQNLRKAFLDFFRNPSAFQYPKFKTKKAQKDSFTVYCRPYHTGPSIRITESGIQMPKLGVLPANLYRKPPLNASLRFVTVTKTKSGKYFCSITFGCKTKKPAEIVPAPERTLGLNYSLTRFYVDSEGGSPEQPQLAKSSGKLAKMQRKLSRMEYGSKNYEKQLQKVRLQYEHIANQRRDFIHKESRRIANAWDAVCVRGDSMSEISQLVKRGNALEAGFGTFRECLRYKLARQGKPLIVVDRYTPTTRTCAVCGLVRDDEVSYRHRSWRCPKCGTVHNREVNAAKNVKAQGLDQYFGYQEWRESA